MKEFLTTKFQLATFHVNKLLLAAEDPFNKTNNLGKTGITKVQGVGIVTFGLAVVILGLFYGLGGREMKAKIKSNFIGIAIGIIAVSAGPSIVEWFFNFVNGTGA
ncbi:hypothetical protein [Streptococcus sobrinus]|uniref:hypothetical protein n=1 Tax=Streptococcus sobrinus TaxID=1310 RepID=UPI00036CDD58|nr:hypothetical protein [Streptococcus sobrinus]